MKNIFPLVLIMFLQACDVSVPPSEKNRSRAKDTPEVAKMLEAFKAQKHRIELNGCEMLYNGKPFRLGMTVKELIDIFGPYDFFNRGYYVWEKAGVSFLEEIGRPESVSAIVEYLNIFLNENVKIEDFYNLKHMTVINESILLVDGVPLKKDFEFREFIGASNFSLDEFSISTLTYELDHECVKKTRYIFMVNGGWVYKGSGHLMMKSHPNEDNDNKIKSLIVHNLQS